MEYENETQTYDDDARGYRERSPRAENGEGRNRSASPDGRDRMDTRPPPDPVDDEDEARNPGTNLFVTGIAPRLGEEDITRLFEKYGIVDKCAIMRDPHTRESRGFGFVNMANADEADAAREGLQGEVYEGRTLSIEKARRARPRTSTPGRYYGPPKRGEFRGSSRGRYDRFDDRRGGGYRSRRDDDYYGRPPRERYDDRGYGRRDRYDDRPPRDDRYGGGRPPRRDYYDEPRGGGRDAPRDAPAYAEPAAGGSRGYEDRDDRYARR